MSGLPDGETNADLADKVIRRARVSNVSSSVPGPSLLSRPFL